MPIPPFYRPSSIGTPHAAHQAEVLATRASLITEALALSDRIVGDDSNEAIAEALTGVVTASSAYIAAVRAFAGATID